LHLKGEENDIYPVLVDAWTVLKVIFKKKKKKCLQTKILLDWGIGKGRDLIFNINFHANIKYST